MTYSLKIEDRLLEEDFLKHVEIAAKMPPQTPDDMLRAYAFFKQATVGNNSEERPKDSSKVIQTFKYDAWKRLDGMDKEQAKREYIKTIKRMMAR